MRATHRQERLHRRLRTFGGNRSTISGGVGGRARDVPVRCRARAGRATGTIPGVGRRPLRRGASGRSSRAACATAIVGSILADDDSESSK